MRRDEWRRFKPSCGSSVVLQGAWPPLASCRLSSGGSSVQPLNDELSLTTKGLVTSGAVSAWKGRDSGRTTRYQLVSTPPRTFPEGFSGQALSEGFHQRMRDLSISVYRSGTVLPQGICWCIFVYLLLDSFLEIGRLFSLSRAKILREGVQVDQRGGTGPILP